jgi:DNA-binding transcriptional ArsR family regulator
MSNTEAQSPDLQSIADIDRLVHEPSRLMILAVLSAVASADFMFLLQQTGLTKGNLSSHLSRLEDAGYIEIDKAFVDKIPRTLLCLTDAGREAFQGYRHRMLQVLGDLET